MEVRRVAEKCAYDGIPKKSEQKIFFHK